LSSTFAGEQLALELPRSLPGVGLVFTVLLQVGLQLFGWLMLD
jgi:hypothetical protein